MNALPDLPKRVAHLWKPLISDLERLDRAGTAQVLLLELVLRCLARLYDIGELLTADEFLVAGSTGQTRINHLLKEEAALRREVTQGLRLLGLLDPFGAPGSSNLIASADDLRPFMVNASDLFEAIADD